MNFQHNSKEIIIQNGTEIRYNKASNLYLNSEYYFEKQPPCEYIDREIFNDLELSKICFLHPVK